MSYTPRPGSKTAAAIDFIRAAGGSATRTAIRDSCDIDLRSMSVVFKLAVDGGLLEECDIDGANAYRIVGSAPETRAQALARELQVTTAVPARCSAHPWEKPGIALPRGKEMPAPEKPEPKKTVRQMARSLKIESFADVRPEAVSPPPVVIEPPLARPFRIGKFSDGTLRLEGDEADIFMEPFEDTEVTAITLSSAAAEKLVAYLASR